MTEKNNKPVIWLVNHYAQEPGGAGGTRHFSLAKQLQARGFAPYIIAASTEHNVGRQRLADHESIRVDTIEGIPFVWLRTSPYAGNGLKRLWNMIDFGFRVRSSALLKYIPKPDIVIGSTPDPFAALGAERAAKKHNAKFVCEVRDFWPISLIELGKLKAGHPLARLMFSIESHLYKKAARILVVQQRSDLYLTPRGVAAEKIVWLPNGIDLTMFPDPGPKAPEPSFTFMYFGAHGNGNALDNVLHAMIHVEEKDPEGRFRLRLIGDGPLKASLQELAKTYKLTRVSFEPPIPKRDIPALAAQADALLFNVVDMPILKYGISANKLFDYLAARRPVVFACNAVNNPVEDAKAGITVPAGDAHALADAMLGLAARGPEELLAMGERGRAYVALNHSVEAIGATLATTLSDLCAEK